MPDPTRARAYLARIKDQEKDVIAVPDGAGRALCVSSDKHWTLTREWDELHIIAPLVEEARWGQNYLDADTKALRLERQAATISELQGSFLRVERERDEWRARAEAAEQYAQAVSDSNRDNADRASKAERERDEWEEKYLDTDEALHRTRRERDEWKARATPAVDDPALYVIRESDIPTVQQDEDGDWYPEGRWDLADDRFIDVEGALEKMHRYAAIARAIEAKEDPIMVRTRELLDLAYPGEYAWTGAFETCRKIAEAEARLEDRHVDQ